MLASALNRQATVQVNEDMTSLFVGSEATYGAITTTLCPRVSDVDVEDERVIVLSAQLQERPSLSWVTFGRRDGTCHAVDEVGAGLVLVRDPGCVVVDRDRISRRWRGHARLRGPLGAGRRQ